MKKDESILNNKKFLQIEDFDKMSKKRKNKIIERSNTKIEKLMPVISSIIKDIQKDGDKALLRYTEKFDHVNLPLSKLIVTKEEIKRAYTIVDNEYKDIVKYMQDSIDCIQGFHSAEKKRYFNGAKGWEDYVKAQRWKKSKYQVGQLNVPLNRIGIYVPGGNAPLFTTALMAITPAKVAKVKEIIVTSPPCKNGDIDPLIIVAADLAGADVIIRAGGPQAIGALAYGTNKVPKVEKIFGPGNIFVTTAKSYVSSNGICAIDFLAGPSEIIIVADNAINKKRIECISRDMLSQSEHDFNACSILLTDSINTANKVRNYIKKELGKEILSTDNNKEINKFNQIAIRSLFNYGAIIKFKNLIEAISFSNEFAPEHLEIMTGNPGKYLDKITNAGTICLGEYTPVAVSDYIGPNHILPTGGAARYTSGINIGMFFKRISFLKTDQKIIHDVLDTMIERLSKAELLYQHGLSVKARLPG